MRSVCGDNPKPFDFSGVNAIDNLVVSPGILGRNTVFPEAQNTGYFLSMASVEKVVTSQKICCVREKARTHGVALTCDRIRPGSGTSDVAGHQGKIDDGLGCAGGFVSLVDTHRPPEGDAAASMNGVCKTAQLANAQPCSGAHCSERELPDKFRERFEIACVALDKLRGDAAFGNQQVGEAVKQSQIALGIQSIMLGGGHRRLGFAGIDNDDFRPI